MNPNRTSKLAGYEPLRAGIVKVLEAAWRGGVRAVNAIMTAAFPLSWSHCVLLLKARSPEARAFYQAETLRGGWPVGDSGAPDVHTVLRAHRTLPRQGGHIAQACSAPSRRGNVAR
jgi:hypothetical protein